MRGSEVPGSEVPGSEMCGQVRDRGSVTAEAAVAVPALVVFAMALVWALMAASEQIQCVDAARAGARAGAGPGGAARRAAGPPPGPSRPPPAGQDFMYGTPS
ncbi:TadE family type IV pilus minor pilin, partial [Streptomyces sp. NPDC002926]